MNLLQTIQSYVNQGMVTLADKGYNVPASVTVRLNGRLSRSLGRAVVTRNPFGTQYIIEINSKAFKEDSIQLRETTLHEVAHLVDYTHHKQEMSHGKGWQKCMRALGLKPEVCASAETVKAIGYTVKPRKERVHHFVCPCCGKKYAAKQRYINAYGFDRFCCTVPSCNKQKLVLAK